MIHFNTITKFLFLCVAFCSVVASAHAINGTTDDGLSWDFTDGVLTISGEGSMDDYATSTFGGGKKSPWYAHRDSVFSIVVEEGVISLGTYAFSGNTKCTSITLPASLENIAGYAFMNCSTVVNIVSKAILPPVCAMSGASGYTNFKNIPNNCRVYVPEASIAAYQATDSWSAFSNYLPYVEGGDIEDGQIAAQDTLMTLLQFYNDEVSRDGETVYMCACQAIVTHIDTEAHRVYIEQYINKAGAIVDISHVYNNAECTQVAVGDELENLIVVLKEEGSNIISYAVSPAYAEIKNHGKYIKNVVGDISFLTTYMTGDYYPYAVMQTKTIDFGALAGEVFSYEEEIVVSDATGEAVLMLFPDCDLAGKEIPQTATVTGISMSLSELVLGLRSSSDLTDAKYKTPQTAVDEVITTQHAHKILRNGQILLYRNGELFNVMGTQVQ